MWLWRAGALPEVPAVAAEPYRLLLAGDWRGAAGVWEALGCPYDQAQALAHADDEDAVAVDHHVSALLAKLSVASRLQVALAARELGIVAGQAAAQDGEPSPST